MGVRSGAGGRGVARELIDLRIRRQDTPEGRPRWEEFAIPHRPMMNVISCLMELQRHPVTLEGRPTTPVVWESSCLEEVCGACSMLINGRVRQACSALVDQLPRPIVLEPMGKFPVIRDLIVDRSRMFEALKRVKAWIPIDGTSDHGPGPRLPERERAFAYELSRCMTCGCCLEACPQVNPRSDFMGPFVIAMVRQFNTHPTGAMHKEARLDALMGEGGIACCSNAQNCQEVCPKGVPLLQAIGEMNRAVTLHALKQWLGA
ncbi:MAG: succinate dehydrogenase iron-sulfur subunit [Deltaproteobacteria bacterium]|nr:succinate dehydrogenase iron-sulfur subunit [Deltaproteobacteria bacterium]